MQLNSLSLPPNTAASEKLEELGGRDGRVILLTGVITGANLEAQLDALLAAASESAYVPLSLRTGRHFLVRRTVFERELHLRRQAASFKLTLETDSPFEEAEVESSVPWPVSASGATLELAPAGNAETLPRLTLTATGTLIAPAISDGTRTLRYTGTLAAGDTLVIDAEAATVTLNLDDVTPYTEGELPRLAPASATLTYTDDPDSSHGAFITVAWRERWW
jgi:hypothetical protein